MHIDWRTFDVTRWQGAKEEEWTGYLIPNHPNSLFYKHWAYAYEVTDAESPFHVQTALTMLAGLVPAHITIPFEPPIPINWFGVLVGPNYASHKTVAIKLAYHLMCQIVPDLWVPMHGSAESLKDYLEVNPQRVFVEQEGGSFLSMTDQEPYTRIRQELNSLYDGSPVHRPTVEKNRERKRNNATTPPTQVQLNARVSLLYGATEPHFAAHTQTMRDWSQGWMRRQCVFAVTQLKNTRTLRQGLTNPAGRNAVLFHLKRLADFPHIGPCAGLTPEASQYLHDWASTRIPQPGNGHSYHKLPKYAVGAIRSAEQHSLKAAALYAFDRHTRDFCSGAHDDVEQLRQNFWITIEDMRHATKLGELHIASTWYLAQNIAQNEHGRVMNLILEKLDEVSGAVPMHEVYNHVELPSRQIDMYLETLLKRHKAYQRGANLCRLQPPTVNEPELVYLRNCVAAGMSPDAPSTQSLYVNRGTIGSLTNALLNPLITDGGSTGSAGRTYTGY